MKKNIITALILVQGLFVCSLNALSQANVSANTEAAKPAKTAVYTTVKKEQVNVYQQPSIKANVIRTVGTADQIEVMREFDSRWTMVKVGDQAGYIMNVNLAKIKK